MGREARRNRLNTSTEESLPERPGDRRPKRRGATWLRGEIFARRVPFLEWIINTGIVLAAEALLNEVAAPYAQGIAVVCTDLPAAAVASRVERATGRPVIDTLSATAWRSLRLAGVRSPLRGFGRPLELP